ncbi:MAG TPA: NDP-hexose 2,3-dehydratase family protein [Candidatus Paceibacterota bacterium]
MIGDNILDFLKNGGHKITEEVRGAASNLAEILEAEESGSADITGVLEWLEKKRKAYQVKVKEISMNDLDKWIVNPQTGHISHESGKFFSIIGAKVEGAAGREVMSWSQPMVKQEECGILGILCQKRQGIMQYLFYAKFEPGTIASLQLSPTLQATESNLRRVHGGKKPLFAEYFENGGRGKILVNTSEVEDPGRNYHKTNRCMIVEVPEDEDIAVSEDYIWITLPQVKKLLKIDNVIVSLARCVLGSR